MKKFLRIKIKELMWRTITATYLNAWEKDVMEIRALNEESFNLKHKLNQLNHHKIMQHQLIKHLYVRRYQLNQCNQIRNTNWSSTTNTKWSNITFINLTNCKKNKNKKTSKCVKTYFEATLIVIIIYVHLLMSFFLSIWCHFVNVQWNINVVRR